MSLWTQQMDRLNTLARDTFGKPTSYQRPGYPAFSITGMPEFLDRLENVDQGQFYSLFYRTADFDLAPFTASVKAIFSAPPNVDGTLTFDGITYSDVLTLDNSTPYQFLRGSSAMGAASNLSSCINADPAVAGTYFSSSTPPHPTCSADWMDNGDGTATTTVSALLPGFMGDTLIAVDHMTNVSLDSRLFYGGGPKDNDLVTVDDTLFRVSDVPEPDPEGEIQIRLEKKAL
jgi:hypothetical protein